MVIVHTIHPAVLRQMIVHGFPKFHTVLEALVCFCLAVCVSLSLCHLSLLLGTAAIPPPNPGAYSSVSATELVGPCIT